MTQLEVGGAQVRVFQTASELRSRGHAAEVVFLYQKRAVFNDEPKTILAGSKRPSKLGILAAIWKLRRMISAGGYDVIITNTAPANLIGNLVAFSAGLKNRVAVQTQPPSRISSSLSLADHIFGTVGVYDKIVANSGYTYHCFDRYSKAYRSRLKLIYNGLNPRLSSASKELCRKNLELPRDDFLFVNVGRLSVQKNQAELLQAMVDVPAVLAIAGAGELEQQLRQMAQDLGVADRVKFLGELTGDQIGELFKAADAFAFSSRWETFGLALLEAAAAGLPLVVSDLDVSREVLGAEMENSALFVSLDTPGAFSRAMSMVLNSSDLRDEMARAGRQRAEVFSIQNHVTELEKLVSA
ncbi:glycosyltransferase family 4 protein [Novosphingobium sp. RD2P27]|uniref:Glycosyltransferase family 4 protein n=1 Tax=Novosphingobium kalidii TaxID=3230299 RepID=A0ABV2D4S2_9SPHN